MKLKGKDFLLYINGKPLCYERSVTIDIVAELKEATRPPASTWKSYYPTVLGYTIQSEGFVSVTPISDKSIFSELQQAQIDRTPLTWKAHNRDETDTVLSGTVYVTSAKQTGNMEDMCSYSLTLTGTGELGKAEV